MSRRIIGIIGNANLRDNKEKEEFALEIGKLVVDNNFILATGGLGGVMEAASRGARNSKNYTEGSIIGVIPDYDKSIANQFIDILIPTGMGLARNIILTSMCDAIIAIGGGAGTLGEITHAWQMGKLIVAVDIEGWSSKVLDESLDSRRKDRIFAVKSPQETIDIILENIDSYQDSYHGVQKSRLGKEKARDFIKKALDIIDNLEFLGSGLEGYIFTDKKKIYKLIDNSDQPLELFWFLQALSEDLKGQNTTHILPFEVRYEKPLLLITYDYRPTEHYEGCDEEEFINLMKEIKKIGWVYTNFQPNNIRIVEVGDRKIPIIVDIGRSFSPYTSELFRKMARRVFLTAILPKGQDIKPLLSETNKNENFEGLKQYNMDPSQSKKKFLEFYKKIQITDKKDVLNPVLKEIISSRKDIGTLFDYGSGHGDISKMINDGGIKVTAYDIDKDLYHKYKDKYYRDIDFVNKDKMKELISSGNRYDCVLCSLVFCHPVADTKEERDNIIDGILKDLKKLSGKYIIITICNPIHTFVTRTGLQERRLPKDFRYSDETEITKVVASSGGKRQDIHRPLSYYEELFSKHNLRIMEIHQTVGENIDNQNLFYSDFMVFLLGEGENGEKV